LNSQEAYRHCEGLTRAAAGNFYYGIRLLPRSKRRAMCAVYAFARRIDDIGDGELSTGHKRQALDQAVAALSDLPETARQSTDPVIVALADSIRRFPLPTDALSELIEGVGMDVEGHTYEDFAELVLYCQRVAGGIGRLCTAIFGADELETAWPLASELGVAMQLTNILRDIREDAQIGRLYIPRSDLERFGLLSTDESRPPAQALLEILNGSLSDEAHHPELDALIHFQVRRARVWFERGMTLVEMLDHRSGACVLAMSGIYRRLLEVIDEDPARAVSERVSLTAREKTLLAARGVLGVGA
jgi:phytoene synthase